MSEYKAKTTPPRTGARSRAIKFLSREAPIILSSIAVSLSGFQIYIDHFRNIYEQTALVSGFYINQEGMLNFDLYIINGGPESVVATNGLLAVTEVGAERFGGFFPAKKIATPKDFGGLVEPGKVYRYHYCYSFPTLLRPQKIIQQYEFGVQLQLTYPDGRIRRRQLRHLAVALATPDYVKSRATSLPIPLEHIMTAKPPPSPEDVVGNAMVTDNVFVPETEIEASSCDGSKPAKLTHIILKRP